MSADSMTFRVSRLYAAIGANMETDLAKFPATVIANDKFTYVSQNFRGGWTDEQIYNNAIQVIHSIANLRDNLFHWAGANGKDKQRVRDTFNASFHIRVIQDLSNNEKHGYPLTHSSKSGRDPKLVEVNRGLQIGAKGKGWSGVFLGAGGALQKFGDGSAAVVVTGVVADKHGTVIGDLHDIESKAVDAWEALLVEFGVTLPAANSPST
jgi:hypothetical protein